MVFKPKLRSLIGPFTKLYVYFRLFYVELKSMLSLIKYSTDIAFFVLFYINQHFQLKSHQPITVLESYNFTKQHVETLQINYTKNYVSDFMMCCFSEVDRWFVLGVYNVWWLWWSCPLVASSYFRVIRGLQWRNSDVYNCMQTDYRLSLRLTYRHL